MAKKKSVRRNLWTRREENVLRRMWPRHRVWELFRVIRQVAPCYRSWSAIKKKASRLGLRMKK